MTQHRPDLLPLAGYVTLGLPYHGLVKNGNAQADPPVAGTLYLPSDATRSYTQPYDGGCIMVQHPKHAALTRNPTEQAYDTARDHQWLEYALLSGRLHQIGGQDLGQHYHLYCDANYTWKIRTALSGGTGSCTLRIYLSGLFGMISDTSYAMTERLLATYTWSPESTAGVPLSSSTVGNRYLATYSKTGAKMVMNVGTSASVSGLRHTISTQHNASFLMHDAVRVTISGNGSIESGQVGTGITATIEHIAWGDELFDNAIVGSMYTETNRYHYVTDANGAETHIETTKENDCEYTPWVPGVTGGDVTSYQTRTISFGGVTYTSTFTYTGTFAAGGTCLNEGTATINGTEVELCDDSGTVQNCMYNSYDAEFTVETVLPLVAVVVKGYDNTYLVTGSGAAQTWAETTSQYYTHNPATGSVQVNGASRICFV